MTTTGRHRGTVPAIDQLTLHTGGAGLMIGRNRTGDPVVLDLFTRATARVALIGGLGCAQLIALRALALPARVVVRTARPDAWHRFAAAVDSSLSIAPPGVAVAGLVPGSRQLVVHDGGGPIGHRDEPDVPGRTVLQVRDELTAWDVDTLVRADLVLMQPLTEVEAALAASSLRIGRSQPWLVRIGTEMVTLVSRREVSWATLSPTDAELEHVAGLRRY